MRNRAAVSLQVLDNEDDYEAALGKCSGVTGYHRWFFLDALSQVKRLRLEAFAVESGGETIGVFPVLLRPRGLISMANDVYIPNIGPVARETEYFPDILRAADSYLRKRRAVVANWRFGPGVEVPPELLARFGFTTFHEDDFMVPADRSADEHLATMQRQKRQEIRLAEARGWYARTANIAEIADWVADRIGDAYKRKGEKPEYTADMARQLLALLGHHPRMLWRSSHDAAGNVIAVTASIIDVERVWWWLLLGGYNRRPSSHIMAYWDIIKWSLQNGLSCDFGGAPNDGIRNFKIRLGGVNQLALRGERVSPAAYRAIRSIHGHTVGQLG